MNFLIAIAKMIIASYIAAALASKPKVAKPPALTDWEFPVADEGTPQSVWFGDCWSPSWMVLGVGNYRTRPVKVSDGLGGSQKIGYRFFFGLHMGLGRGPLDELVEIEVGGRTAWSGAVTANEQSYIDQPNLFGGEKKEGGIQGPLDVMMGEPDQPVNAALAAMNGGITPAFRGVTTLFYDGLISAMSQYPKPWKIRARRGVKGWDGTVWYPEKCVVDLAGGAIKAMNPAHILMECLTNRDWGRGWGTERLDLASYQAAADQLYSEGFGMCLRWTRQDSLEQFIQVVLDHFGGAQYISRTTGLSTLVLIRGGYDPESLPLFDYKTGLLSIEEETVATGATAPNEIIVTYRDPVTNNDKQLRAKNLGAIQAAGVVFSQSVDYPGIPTRDLAARVAERDLRANLQIKRYKLRFDRRGYKISPAGLFRISAIDLGIENLVLRAGRVETGSVTDGAITITALEDVYGLPDAVYSEEQTSTWQPPDREPLAALDQRLTELSYRDLCQRLSPGDRNALSAEAGLLCALAVRPNGMAEDYLLVSRVGAAAYQERGDGDWVPTGLLQVDLDRAATAITLIGGVDLDLVEEGMAALIDTEIVRVESINATTGAVTIARGCADTIPAEHIAGTRIWIYENFAGGDVTSFSDGVEVFGKFVTRTSADTLDENLASASSVTMDQRQARPYPPGSVLLNNVMWPSSITGALTISWAHRDRLAQEATLVPWIDNSIGPEAGVTYTLRLYDETNTLVRTETGLIGVSYTWADEIADSGLGRLNNTVRVELWSVRDGLDSWQVYDHTVDRTA